MTLGGSLPWQATPATTSAGLNIGGEILRPVIYRDLFARLDRLP